MYYNDDIITGDPDATAGADAAEYGDYAVGQEQSPEIGESSYDYTYYDYYDPSNPMVQPTAYQYIAPPYYEADATQNYEYPPEEYPAEPQYPAAAQYPVAPLYPAPVPDMAYPTYYQAMGPEIQYAAAPPYCATPPEEYYEEEPEHQHSRYVLGGRDSTLPSKGLLLSDAGTPVEESPAAEQESKRAKQRYKYFPNDNLRTTADFRKHRRRRTQKSEEIASQPSVTESHLQYELNVIENQRLRQALRNLGKAVEDYAMFQLDQGTHAPGGRCDDSKDEVLVVRKGEYSCDCDSEDSADEDDDYGMRLLIEQQGQLEREKLRLQRRLCFQLGDSGADAKARGFSRTDNYGYAIG